MARLGMDVEAIGNLADQLDAQGRSVDHVVSTIEGLVSRAVHDWHGRGADEFAARWHRQFKPALQSAADHLHGLAAAARDNATEQTATSNETRAVPAASAGTLTSLVRGLDDAHTGLSRLDDVRFLVSLGLIGGLSAVRDPRVLSMATKFSDEAIESARWVGPLAKGVRVGAPMVTAFYDGTKIGEDLANGRGLTGDVAQAALDVASVNPYVATFNLSQEATKFVLTDTSVGRSFVDQTTTAIFDVGASHEHGSDATATAELLSHRYDGFSGGLHFGEDSFQAAGEGFVAGAKSIWSRTHG